ANEKRPDASAVVVTGASSGIGKAIALELAQRGFVVFAGVRTAEDEGALQAEAGVGPGQLRPVRLDVTDQEQLATVTRTVEAEAGRLAGVVSNAGIAVAAPLEFVPLEDLRQQLE